MKKLAVATACLLAATCVVAQPKVSVGQVPEAGFVPDSETAIRIALAVWEPIYGKEQIASEAPYYAVLKGDTWFVAGSLPKGWAGGVATAEIAKRNGAVLRVIHGK